MSLVQFVKKKYNWVHELVGVRENASQKIQPEHLQPHLLHILESSCPYQTLMVSVIKQISSA